MQVTKGTREGFSEVRFDVKPPESVREALKGGRVRLAGRERLLRVEGDAEPGRCAVVAPITPRKPKPVPV